MFIAKPNLFNSDGVQQFDTEIEAIQYLEKTTGIEMDYEVKRRKDKKTGKTVIVSKTSDWYLVGKLIEV